MNLLFYFVRPRSAGRFGKELAVHEAVAFKANRNNTYGYPPRPAKPGPGAVFIQEWWSLVNAGLKA